jgi:hypothetical protein
VDGQSTGWTSTIAVRTSAPVVPLLRAGAG